FVLSSYCEGCLVPVLATADIARNYIITLIGAPTTPLNKVKSKSERTTSTRLQ
ncbi:hypothetical protein E2562_036599, partial [Oryza meyeriana var. granulata]